MKRNTLTAAILAGVTGVAGMVNVSHAVNLNPDGLGQVLLYPFYTTRGGNDTLISVVNTTTEAKAVKVRFIEALNSREVLDFNLYLSPFDVWTAALTLNEATGGGRMVTADRSCTVPYFVGEGGGVGIQEFLPFQYTGDNFDAGPQTLERTASGYIEFIEMGSIPDASVFFDAIKHVNGTPRSGGPFGAPCDVIVGAWLTGGTWDTNAQAGLADATGGLFGTGSIVNVEDGTLLSYDATAIDAFWAVGQIEHTNPGFITPNLNSTTNTMSNVFSNGQVVTDTWDLGVQAVNATITFDQLMNEYNVNPALAARSEWVVTFPTKGFHTDLAFGGNYVGLTGDPVPPFTDVWTFFSDFSLSPACESMDIDFWDREERTQQQGLIVSPPPPVQGFQLCREANVIRFSSDASLPASTEILKEPQRSSSALTYTNFGLPSGFNAGWLQFNFGNVPSSAGGGERFAVSQDGTAYFGLPVIGFWAQRFTNGLLTTDAGDNVLANYAGSYNHKGSRRITQLQPQ